MEFKLLGRDTVYEGRAYNLEHVHALLPDGNRRRYDLVQHKGSVTIVPVDAEGNLLFVRQYRVGAEKVLLELPAGVIDKEDDPVVCAARECREETGMAAGRLLHLGAFYLAPGYSSEFMHIFLAADLTPDPLPGDADEFLTLVKIPIAEALAMARRGELEDGKSLAALLLAEAPLQSR
jgi:ADP-ribose pyrophosphatase